MLESQNKENDIGKEKGDGNRVDSLSLIRAIREGR